MKETYNYKADIGARSYKTGHMHFSFNPQSNETSDFQMKKPSVRKLNNLAQHC